MTQHLQRHISRASLFNTQAVTRQAATERKWPQPWMSERLQCHGIQNKPALDGNRNHHPRPHRGGIQLFSSTVTNEVCETSSVSATSWAFSSFLFELLKQQQNKERSLLENDFVFFFSFWTLQSFFSTASISLDPCISSKKQHKWVDDDGYFILKLILVEFILHM